MKNKSEFSVNKIIKALMAAGLLCSGSVSAGNLASTAINNNAWATSDNMEVTNSTDKLSSQSNSQEKTLSNKTVKSNSSNSKNVSEKQERSSNNKVDKIVAMETPIHVVEAIDVVKEAPQDFVEEEMIEAPTDLVEEEIIEAPTDLVEEEIIEAPTDLVEEEIIEAPTDIVEEEVIEEPTEIVEETGITEEVTAELSYVVVDTMESECFDLEGEVLECGSDLVGQDAEYLTTEASYEFYDDDETAVLDNNTGLIWERAQSSDQYVFNDAADYCSSQTTAGYDEWRLPTMKELYSLADFDGDMNSLIPYIDTRYFDFEYASMTFATQFWSSNVYNVNVVGGSPDDDEAYVAAHGFNFADGHIKAYGTEDSQPGLYIRCVMGDEDVYGVNDYAMNKDETIVTDNATGLMWQQADDGNTYEWTDALAYCEDLTLGEYDDWRLPDNKELQSIVEYSKTDVPAIDTDFFASTFNDSYGGGDFDGDYGWYWTSTTLKDFPLNASYIAFGRAYSTTSEDLTDTTSYHDWHGAGAQRSDPKDGVVEMDGDSCSITACDEERGTNYVRCVRGDAEAVDESAYDDYVSEATSSSTSTEEDFDIEEGALDELEELSELELDFESAVTYLETLGVTMTTDELDEALLSLETLPPLASEVAESLSITEDEATELMSIIGFPTE